jgi:hypothetical protein
MAFTAIASQTLTSSATGVTFSSIPGTFRDLVLVIDKVRAVNTGRTFFVRFNGSAVNYSSVYMTSNGPSGQSAFVSNNDNLRIYPFSHPAVPGQEPNYKIEIFDYQQTNKHKSVLVVSDNWDAAATRYAARWGETAAITSITVQIDSGNIVAGATFSLYGVSA